MMKKEYINPELEVIKIETQQMLALSGDSSNPLDEDAGGAASPEMNMFGW